jgi:hypothetical protein
LGLVLNEFLDYQFMAKAVAGAKKRASTNDKEVHLFNLIIKL